MKFFVINLKNRPERLADISALAASFKLPLERICALDGRALRASELEAAVDSERLLFEHGRLLGAGEIGCALSHKRALEALLKSDSNWGVIFEDDVIFEQNLVEFLRGVDDGQIALPADLQLLLLGHQRQVYNDDGFRIESPHSRRFCWPVRVGGERFCIRRLVGRGNGAYGYMVSKAGAARLLAELTRLYAPFDVLTSNERVVNFYALFPVLVRTNPRYMRETSTQDGANLARARPKWRKWLKRAWVWWRFLLPSLRRLRPYGD